MSMKDKALQVKQDFDDVYEAGKENIISNSKYIEKQASGKVIRLDDVSEVAHKVKVKADTPTEVKVYGSNFVDYTKAETRSNTSTVVINTDGSITYTGNYFFRIPVDTLERNTNYTLSYKGGADTARWALAYDGIGNTSSVVAMGEALKTRDDADVRYIFVYPYKPNDDVATTTISDIQLSFGDVVKPYEPYNKQIITATTNGAEISSLCPNMTFFADNDITVDYYGSYGMQAQRLEWWGKYLAKQKTNGLYNGFAGYGWTDVTFDPPFDIETNLSSSMFAYSFVEDLRGILARNNVKIIFMNTSRAQHYNVFASSRLKYCPYLKLPEAALCYGFFTNCSRLIEVDGYECTEKHTFETSSGANKTFQGCTNLEHIIFHGTIANTINLQWSTKLDRASILSLLQCLNATVSGIVITLPSMCIDGATDTLALIQSDTELNTAYTNALAKGYTITFA